MKRRNDPTQVNRTAAVDLLGSPVQNLYVDVQNYALDQRKWLITFRNSQCRNLWRSLDYSGWCKEFKCKRNRYGKGRLERRYAYPLPLFAFRNITLERVRDWRRAVRAGSIKMPENAVTIANIDDFGFVLPKLSDNAASS